MHAFSGVREEHADARRSNAPNADARAQAQSNAHRDLRCCNEIHVLAAMHGIELDPPQHARVDEHVERHLPPA
jgi:hypothetical protein